MLRDLPSGYKYYLEASLKEIVSVSGDYPGETLKRLLRIKNAWLEQLLNFITQQIDFTVSLDLRFVQLF